MEYSVLQLINELCDKCIPKYDSNIYAQKRNNNKLINHLRKRAFDILLNKSTSFNDSENKFKSIQDFSCQISVCRYKLEAAGKYAEANHFMKCINSLDVEKYQSIIKLLMLMADEKVQNDDIQFKSLYNIKYTDQCNKPSVFKYHFFKAEDFLLPRSVKLLHSVSTQSLKCCYLPSFNEAAFKSPPGSHTTILEASVVYEKNNQITEDDSIPKFPALYGPRDLLIPTKNDRKENICNYKNVSKTTAIKTIQAEEDVWDLALKGSRNSLRTWEEPGNFNITQELPFLSETGDKCIHAVWNIQIQTARAFARQTFILNSIRVLSAEQFSKDIKNMLVGIRSHSFYYCENDQAFKIQDCTCIKSVAPDTVKCFIQELLECGTLYKKLYHFSSTISIIGTYHSKGYIFTQLCSSLQDFLLLYSLSICNMQEVGILSIYEKIKPLYKILQILSNLCKSYSDVENVPKGSYILLLLYNEINNSTNKSNFNILISIFHKCCQTYFRRFIQPWLFEGKLNDPYNEFFIEYDSLHARGKNRKYWVHCFHEVSDIELPSFLKKLVDPILKCGKTLHLLKRCMPNSPFCFLSAGETMPFKVCLSERELIEVTKNYNDYYKYVSDNCGDLTTVSFIYEEQKVNEEKLKEKATKKQVDTIKRLKSEKVEHDYLIYLKKRQQLKDYQEQMAEVTARREAIAKEERQLEMEYLERIKHQEEKDQIRLDDEKKKLREYYDELSKTADQQKYLAELKIKKMKLSLKQNIASFSLPLTNDNVIDNLTTPTNNNLAVQDIATPTEIPEIIENNNTANINKQENVDFDKNYNTDTENTNNIVNNNEVVTKSPKPIEIKIDNFDINKQVTENFNAAKQNKARVLNQELGIDFGVRNTTKAIQDENSEFYSNRNKILSRSKQSDTDIITPKEGNEESEFHRNRRKILNRTFADNQFENNSSQNIQLQTNRNRILTHSDVLNIKSPETVVNNNINKQSQLTDLQRNRLKVLSHEYNVPLLNIKPKFNVNNNKNTKNIEPLISTPESPYVDMDKLRLNIDICSQQSSLPTSETLTVTGAITSNSNASDNMFWFPSVNIKPFSKPLLISEEESTDTIVTSKSKPLYKPSYGLVSFESLSSINSHSSIPLYESSSSFYVQNIENEEPDQFVEDNILQCLTEKVSSNNEQVFSTSLDALPSINFEGLDFYIHQSLSIPLKIQSKLINSVIMNYLIREQNILTNFDVLANYYFLLDGVFGRSLTNLLFEKLYEGDRVSTVLNYRILNVMMDKAVTSSGYISPHADKLSFEIQDIPNVIDLNSPQALDCISLSYKVDWPLNIILPSDILAKYNRVFKYLLKIRRVCWSLEDCFQELKSLLKEYGFEELLLLQSPQYRKIQLMRHTMVNWVLALQRHITGTILLGAYIKFKQELLKVTTLDEFFDVHKAYINDVIFKCLLSQRSESVMTTILEIFGQIFKFHNYLRSQQWSLKENDIYYTHPNYKKIEICFLNFQEISKFLIKVGNKLVRVGYQPHLVQMTQSLNMNGYYDDVL